eukprot:632781-Hanusia_phi.AAC.1
MAQSSCRPTEQLSFIDELENDCYDLLISHPFHLPLPELDHPAFYDKDPANWLVEDAATPLSQGLFDSSRHDRHDLSGLSDLDTETLGLEIPSCSAFSQPSPLHLPLQHVGDMAHERSSCPACSNRHPPVVRVQSRQASFLNGKP